MATKKTKKEPKPKPPIRLCAGGSVFHACEWEGYGKVTTTFHDEELTRQVDALMTQKLNEAAKTIIAENPDTGLLAI